MLGNQIREGLEGEKARIISIASYYQQPPKYMCVVCCRQTKSNQTGDLPYNWNLGESVLWGDVKVGVERLGMTRKTSACAEKKCYVAAWPCTCAVTVVVVWSRLQCWFVAASSWSTWNTAKFSPNKGYLSRGTQEEEEGSQNQGLNAT